MIDKTKKFGQQSVVTSNPSANSAGSTHDAAVLTAQTTFLAAPPAGYNGDLVVTTPINPIWDGTNYTFTSYLTWTTLS